MHDRAYFIFPLFFLCLFQASLALAENIIPMDRHKASFIMISRATNWFSEKEKPNLRVPEQRWIVQFSKDSPKRSKVKIEFFFPFPYCSSHPEEVPDFNKQYVPYLELRTPPDCNVDRWKLILLSCNYKFILPKKKFVTNTQVALDFIPNSHTMMGAKIVATILHSQDDISKISVKKRFFTCGSTFRLK